MMQTDDPKAARRRSPRFGEDLADPEEYKDLPIRFVMELDGREEEIKIVEPELDLPLPPGGRLRIYEADACLHDMVFAFEPDEDRPYRFRYAVENAFAYAEEHEERFGARPEADRRLRKHFRKELLDRGGLRAWIEMAHGKARLYVKYRRTGGR